MNVHLYGVLEEVTGHKVLKVDDFRSSDELTQTLKKQIPALNEYTFQIAVNQEIITENTDISSADEIAFLPPFSGG